MIITKLDFSAKAAYSCHIVIRSCNGSIEVQVIDQNVAIGDIKYRKIGVYVSICKYRKNKFEFFSAKL